MAGVFVFSLLFAAIGLILGYASTRLKVQTDPLVDEIDALLPQTQCGQCNFPGCRPYAKAIAKKKAYINQCPPGGKEVINALAGLMGIEPKPLNESHGIEKPASVAFIVETDCIGCRLCIDACPVDAILGAATMMHTVIRSECTGCELCIDPCPVDCIIMTPESHRATEKIRARPDDMPCIRCGDCVPVCPKSLLPQQLFWHCSNDDLERAIDYNLSDCIECGLCDTVCPSQLPLAQTFATAKNTLKALQLQKKKTKTAKRRYINRMDRIHRDQEQRKINLRNKKEALKQARENKLSATAEAQPRQRILSTTGKADEKSLPR